MELVGQILKKNREIKKLSISDISEELKISKEILNNIENNFFEKNIDSVFVLGHIKSYSTYLELNTKEIVDQFKNKYQVEISKNISIQRPKVENSFLYSNKIFSLSLIIILFSSFYILFIEVDKPSRDYAIIPDLPENYISVIEKASIDTLIQNNNIKSIEEKNLAELEVQPVSSSAIASIPLDKKIKLSVITLKILDDTWIQLRDKNDEIVLSQLMNKDDEYSYLLKNNYSLTSGNAGHILVIIDQIVRGKVGKKGQVVDSLVLSSDFSN